MKKGRIVKLSRYISLRNAGYFLLAVFCYSVFFQALYNLLKYDTLLPYADFGDFCLSFVKNFFPILALGVLNVFIVFKLPIPERLERKIWLKSMVDLVVSLAGLVVVNTLYLAVFGLLVNYTSIYAAGTLLSDILILLFVEVAYYVALSRELARRTERLKREALEYRYDALKSQINPHFLFNSLNILYSLIDIDKEKTKGFIRSLTSVYRQVLAFRNRSTVTLGEELDLLRAYVEVLSMRYHNQLFVEMEENNGPVMRRMVVPFSLQLLFENVIKHNEVSSLYPMRVEVKVRDSHVEVSNRIKRRTVSDSSGIGLRYIEQQYARFGKILEVNDDGKVFTASLPYLF